MAIPALARYLHRSSTIIARRSIHLDFVGFNKLDFSGDNSGAKTIGGSVLATVYDFWRPQKEENRLEKRDELGRYQDFLAEAAADTFAVLPKYGPIIAGLTRASLLIKPSESLSMNVRDFALNAGQGMALRKVALMASPDVSAGFMPRAGAFFIQGFSFGAIKGSFRADSWMDEKSNLAIKQGIYSTISAGIYAGLLGMPTGYFGSKIATSMIGQTTAAGLGVRSSLVVSGVTSGYVTGFVLGGSNAFLEGRSGVDLVEASNSAGLLSALSGAAIMSFTPLRFSAAEKPAADKLSRLSPALNHEDAELVAMPREQLQMPVLNTKDLASLALRNRTEPSAQELLVSSKTFSLENQRVPVLKDQISLGSVPLYSDRVYLATVTKKEPWNLRVYHDVGDPAAPGPLYVKDAYASKLDSTLSTQLAQGELLLTGVEPHHMHVKHALSRVPDPTIIQKAEVRPDSNIHTPFHQKLNLDPFMQISATANSAKGKLSFTMHSDSVRNVHNVVDHEWGHLLEPKVPQQRALFEVAALVERKGYYVTDYARKTPGENWAEHTASFLGTTEAFLEFVHNAPLRAIPIARGIGRAVENVELKSPGFSDPGLLARLRYTEEKILPLTLENLHSRLDSSTKMDTARVSILLGALGGSKDLTVLSQLAARGNSPAPPYFALLSRQNADQYKISGYSNVRLNDQQAQLRDFLSFHVNPTNSSSSRTLALEGLSNQAVDASFARLIGKDLDGGNRQFYEFLALIMK